MTPADLLAASDERDQQLQLRLDAYRQGYAAAAALLGEAEAAGYARAVADFKRAQHEHVHELRQHLTTWDGLREDFGKPRPTDYTRKDAA